MKDQLTHHFPNLELPSLEKLLALPSFYQEWNQRVNLVSRKDIQNLFEHHILHSLSIAKYIAFPAGSRILDIGTGGGFPGLPLSILFPSSEFVLVDSIQKKIRVIESAKEQFGLDNVRPIWKRAEQLNDRFDFIVSRAVAPLTQMIEWSSPLLERGSIGSYERGLIYLKGGDIQAELAGIDLHVSTRFLSEWFDSPYFKEKVLIHIRFT